MIDERKIKDFFLKLEKVEGIEREIKIEAIKNKAFCIVGPRKTGKTWYLRMNALDQPYINLQDLAFKGIKVEEFFKVIEIYSSLFKKEVKKIFIDEIQEIKNWEYLILSLLNRGYNVIVSGSSSKILKKEFASALRGKCIIKILLPFSFREYLIAKNFKEKIETFEGKGRLLGLLENYLINGSYPEVVLNENKKEFLWKSYFDEIFYRDFVERHKIKNYDLARFIFEFCLQNFSSLISINKIKKFFKGKIPLSDKTIYKYFFELSETLNIFFIRKYSKKIYIRESWPRKVYICDLGIANIVSYSKDLGKRMENAVFLELLRKTNENPLIEIFFFKQNNYEVDFVVKEGLNIKQLIQVTYASNKDEIAKREIDALLKASELLKCKDLIVITWDYENEEKINNKTIKFVPLWKWLLNVNK